MSEYCFTSLSAQSWQYRDRRKTKAGTMPYSYFEWIQGFFIVNITIDSTVLSRPLNSLDHCICTTTMTNILPDRDLSLVPPGYKDTNEPSGSAPPWSRCLQISQRDDLSSRKWNESDFRPPLCTYRLNWARRTPRGWWDDWDDTVLQTQDSKFEPWRSEAEHATSRSRRAPHNTDF